MKPSAPIPVFVGTQIRYYGEVADMKHAAAYLATYPTALNIGANRGWINNGTGTVLSGTDSRDLLYTGTSGRAAQIGATLTPVGHAAIWEFEVTHKDSNQYVVMGCYRTGDTYNAETGYGGSGAFKFQNGFDVEQDGALRWGGTAQSGFAYNMAIGDVIGFALIPGGNCTIYLNGVAKATFASGGASFIPTISFN